MPTYTPSPHQRMLHRCLAVILLFTGGLFVGVSIWFFNVESIYLRDHLQRDLSHISEAAAFQASSWRKEHIRDARTFAHGARLICTQNPEANLLDVFPHEPLVTYITAMFKDRNLENILITDTEGNLLVAHIHHPALPEPETRDLIRQVAQTGDATMGTPYWCEIHQRFHMDTAAPIRNHHNQIIGVLVKIHDLATLSLPTLIHWPLGSHGQIDIVIPTGENHALVVSTERTNEVVLAVDNQRFNPVTRLALKGITGLVETVDDLGEAIVAQIQPIPGSSWILVATMHGDGFHEKAKSRTQLIVLLITSSVLLVGFAMTLIFFRRQVSLNQQLAVTQQISDESEKKYRELFVATTDAIVIFDAATSAILEVNQAMLNMYGYEHSEEIRKHSIGDLSANHPPYDEATAREHLRKTVDHGSTSFEWLARQKNGHLFWVDINLRYTSISNRNCILASVRDTSRRKLETEQKQKQLDELKRWQQTILGREKRVIQLKQEVNQLLEQLGQPPRYTVDEGGGHE